MAEARGELRLDDGGVMLYPGCEDVRFATEGCDGDCVGD